VPTNENEYLEKESLENRRKEKRMRMRPKREYRTKTAKPPEYEKKKSALSARGAPGRTACEGKYSKSKEAAGGREWRLGKCKRGAGKK